MKIDQGHRNRHDNGKIKGCYLQAKFEMYYVVSDKRPTLKVLQNPDLSQLSSLNIRQRIEKNIVFDSVNYVAAMQKLI